MEEQYLGPLSRTMADWVASGHPVSFIHITHVMTITLHNECFYNIPMFITEVTVC
jgi:hypothetical protein